MDLRFRGPALCSPHEMHRSLRSCDAEITFNARERWMGGMRYEAS